MKSLRFVNSWSSNIQTFNRFNEFAQSTSVTKVVKGGFSLANIPIIGGLFGFGAKKKYKEVFNTLRVDTTRAVYGKLDIVYRDSLHRIQVSESTLKDLSGCYHPRFKRDLYESPMQDVLRTYGYFMVSGIESGGLLTALYYGHFNSRRLYEYRGKSMSDSISATLTFKNVGGSVDFSLHKSRGNSTSNVIRYRSIHMSYQSLGGNSISMNFTPPTEIDKLSEINFSSWAESLQNKNLLTVIEFPENGLVPLYDILLEENFKERIKKYMLQGVDNVTQGLIEPYIYMESYGNQDVRFASLSLVTKYGDYILLASKQFPGGIPVSDKNLQLVFNSMIDRGKAFFPGLKVKVIHYYVSVPCPEEDKEIAMSTVVLPSREFVYDAGFQSGDMFDWEFCTCRENSNIYMICRNSRIAFTLADKSTWNQYCLLMPTDMKNLRKVSLSDLIGYRFFAL